MNRLTILLILGFALSGAKATECWQTIYDDCGKPLCAVWARAGQIPEALPEFLRPPENLSRGPYDGDCSRTTVTPIVEPIPVYPEKTQISIVEALEAQAQAQAQRASSHKERRTPRLGKKSFRYSQEKLSSTPYKSMNPSAPCFFPKRIISERVFW